MDEIYNDLENYDDVDLVNQLRTENTELKLKLGECNSSMERLQKDFDNLAADFKRLQTNYSSLLKIARSEIKRKTDMIVNLNIEKDMLVLKAMQGGPRNVQKFVQDVRAEALKLKKKKRNKTGGKDRDAFIRKESERPPSSETSSTANDNNQMTGKERVTDNMTSSNRYTKSEKEVHTLHHMEDGIRSPILDRRVSTLARPRFSKLSSDEEFEHMYSSLEPKPTNFRGADRSRKRVRDDPEDARSYYNAPGSHAKSLNYPDPFREGFNKNRQTRFSDTDRNINRDKPFNDNERYTNRDKYDSHYRKHSPDRRRRNGSGRDYSGDRYPQQPERQRRLESPPRQRYQHRSRERQACRSREREEEKQDIHTYNYPETHRHKAHDDYNEPQNKRPRIEHPNQDDRGHSETVFKQYSKEMYSRDSRDHTCQSPDFSHTENESCNESVREIRSTASTVIEDPRLNSSKYIKRTEGDKDVLCTTNVKPTELPAVNRTLWGPKKVEEPKPSSSKPLEISEEHVEEMEADKPLSIVSMESGEVGSESTDTFLDDFTNYHYREINDGPESGSKYVSNTNDTQKIYNEKEMCPIDNVSKEVTLKSAVVQKESNSASHKWEKSDKVSKRRAEELLEISPKDGNQLGTKMRCESTEKPSVLHKLIESVRHIPDSPERLQTGTLSKNSEVKKLKKIPKLKISFKPDKNLSKSISDKEPISLSELYTSSKSESDSTKNTGKKERRSLREKEKPDLSGMEIAKSSGGDYVKSSSEFKVLDGSDKESLKSEEGRGLPNLCESRPSDKPEKEALKNTDRKEVKILRERRKSEITEKKTSKSSDGNDLKTCSELKTLGSSEKEIPNSIEERKLHNFCESRSSDKPEKEKSKCAKARELPSFCESKASDKSKKELSRTFEGKVTSDRFEKELSKSTHEKDLKTFSVLKKINNSEKEPSENNEEHKSFSSFVTDSSGKRTENNESVFREFEHRVFSTRNIVEGDLELSDESNDEAQVPLKIDKKVEAKKKQKIKRNRDTSKDKQMDSEDTIRTTRSKKDKEKESDTKNKFTELFGDSSSLITPEELGLATKEAHTVPADCCPPLCEDALDGIGETTRLQTQIAKEPDNILETRESACDPTNEQDKRKHKTKDCKTRTSHKKPKDSENSLVPDICNSFNDLPLIATKEQNDNITRNRLASEVKVLSDEKLKEMQKAKVTSDTSKSDLVKQYEKSKEPVKSNKKRKDEKRLSTGELTDESQAKKSYNAKPVKTLDASSNKSSVIGDNKENSSCNDNSEGNVSKEMARIFDDTVVSNKVAAVDNSRVSEEKLLSIEKRRETNVGVENGLNLAPVIDEPGLVKTVVISSGTQPLDSNIVEYTAPLNALATSTPAKKPTMNTSSENCNLHPTTCVNVTIASEDSVSQPETDAPDMRITYYKRRRKVLKR